MRRWRLNCAINANANLADAAPGKFQTGLEKLNRMVVRVIGEEHEV